MSEPGIYTPARGEKLREGFVHVTHKNAPELIAEKEDVGKRAFEKQEYPLAVQMYEECITFLKWMPEEVRAKDMARYLTNMSAAEFAMGRFEESLRHADKALRADKTYLKAHYRRAKALASLDRKVDSVATYLRASAARFSREPAGKRGRSDEAGSLGPRTPRSRGSGASGGLHGGHGGR